MEIDLKGIIIIVGNYGSGKTEVAINLAVNRKQAGMNVSVADLDLVNPYFRTREAKTQLAELGVDLVLPPEPFLKADLPFLSPAIAGLIRKPSQVTILDVGGNDAGATVLAALADAFENVKFRMLQVVNPFRPETETVAGCLQIRDAIQKASKMRIDGIIGNVNLMDETTPQQIYDGYAFAGALQKKSGMPLEFITAARDLIPELDLTRFACPVLTIRRQLVPPWRRAAALGNGR